MTKNKKTKLIFIALLATVIIPMVAGWFLFHFHTKLPFKTQNYGHLINPPIASIVTGNHTWQILYIPKHCCDKTCAATMFNLHQLRIALGKNATRVSLVRAGNTACQTQATHDFQALLLTAHMATKWQAAFSQPFTLTDKIYLVDPLGNIFMYYPVTTNPMSILKDLQFVLGASQIG